MFPVFKVSITGLDPNAMYTLLLDFAQVDNHRWKYVNGEWVAGGKAEPAAPNSVYIHPDSPNFGAHWMREPTSFSKVKLTNKLNGGGQIMLNSLHKYEPRLHIVKVSCRSDRKSVMTYSFVETQFIAVTAYQNEEITSLKIKHNPFAKAFLDAKERPEQRDIIEDPNESQQRSLSHLSGAWFLPAGGATLVPPPAHQFANALNLSNPHCDRLSFRNTRPAPYTHPYQGRTPPPGGYSRDVTSNLPMLNLPENWPHLPTSGHSMLSTNAPATQGQYSMWVGGPMSNISSNQSCAMPYLRTSSNPYTLPSTSTSVPNVQTTAMNTVQPSYESTCDMSGSFPGRDTTGRSSWGHMPTSL
ncbi:T-box transcription factor T homolog 1-like [Octopus vulgaris]|uniref:T-box transcription factor T homolog 1-like n=1 Tax=Octopus vulgaris TaxID=6645 RepID=A0AA36B7N9_OCTVU|nr:T-box transcription factor T homolog 1-like [Octopus vulgaris]